MLIQYVIAIVLLCTGLFVYFRIASKYNIIDKPNQRSSHDYITIRGGGIVFWLAGVLCTFTVLPESLYFLIGITLISGVSLWDDISVLSNKVRLVVHFLSISVMFYGVELFTILPWWGILLAYIFFIGVLNAYNFMDGINGMTGLYSLSILFGLYYINENIALFIKPEFIIYPILACFIFLFCNYRKRAICFAGDVGSMAISFWITTLLLLLMMSTQSFVWILLLAVYGVDTVCTILHRLYLKQNIFKAHRLHLYQILSNEYKIDHRIVSAIYAVVQLIISFILIGMYDKVNPYLLGVFTLFPLLLIYLSKVVLMRKVGVVSKNENDAIL